MSATTSELRYRARSGSRRLIRPGFARTPWLRALLTSRLLVLGAGVAGALIGGRTPGWPLYDRSEITARLGAVGNVLAAPAVRWDSIHYLAIAHLGYADAASTVFYPLYPLLVRLLGDVIGSDPVAGILISVVSFGVALRLLHRLTALELGPRAADAAVALLAFAPLSLFFSAVYTESLFLALSVGSIYAGRRGRWKLAAGLGGLAAATRVTGILLTLPLAIMYRRERRCLDRGLAVLAAVPAGLVAYLGFLTIKGYGFLAPFAQQSNAQHERQMTGPLDTVVEAVRTATLGLRSIASEPIYHSSVAGPFSNGLESVWLLAVLAIAVVALVATFRRLPVPYGAYALVALLVCIWTPVPSQPLDSSDRYALTIFPLWMAAGAWVSERRLTRATVLVSGVLLAFWTFQFAMWAWVA